MPLLAQAIAGGFTALEMEKFVLFAFLLPPTVPDSLSLEPRRMFTELTEALETLEPNDPNLEEVLSKLKETHATSAGLKGS